MPFNNSGTPNSSNLSIPRACVKIALLDDSDNPGPWRDVGDVSSAQLSFDTTEAEHYTSCGEQRVRDARVAVETNIDLSMTFDHILDTANLELIYAAEAISQDSPDAGSAAIGAIFLPNIGYAEPPEDPTVAGRTYKLWSDGPGKVYAGVPYLPSGTTQTIDPDGAGSNPAFVLPTWKPTHHLFQVDASTIEIELATGTENDASGGGTAYNAASGAFSVNAAQGTIFIPQGSPLLDSAVSGSYATIAGAPGNNTNPNVCMKLTYNDTNDSAPQKRPVVQGLAKASRAIAIRFEQQDSNRSGYRAVVEVFKTRLIPSGEVDLISDGTDFSTASLEGSVEQPAWMDGSAGLQGFFHKYDVKDS